MVRKSAKKTITHSPYKRYKAFKTAKNTIIVIIILLVLAFVSFKVVKYSFYKKDIIKKECGLWDNILLIKAHGDVVTYRDSDQKDIDVISSEEIVKYIQEADKNSRIKAIVIDINSFGGSPVAGEEIADALKNSKKITLALIKDVGDSAAYMLATGAQRIFATNFSEIGSIGITMSYLDYSRKYAAEGIIYQQLSSGEFKDIANPSKPLSQNERDMLIDHVSQLQEIFIDIISDNRNIDRLKVEEIADGSIMTAKEAKTRGLIDEIGGLDDIKAYISERIKQQPQICSIN